VYTKFTVIDGAKEIMPLNGSGAHSAYDINCPCNPEIDFDCSGKMIIVHKAFDRRELVEELTGWGSLNHSWVRKPSITGVVRS